MHNPLHRKFQIYGRIIKKTNKKSEASEEI